MAAKTRRGAAPEYVSGTAARKLEPERRQERPREPRQEASSQSRTVTVRRNQEKAQMCIRDSFKTVYLYTLNRNNTTSPSFTTYSFPSIRTSPFSLAAE